jgi:replicative DNA helicase
MEVQETIENPVNEFFTSDFRKMFLKLIIENKLYFDIFSPHISIFIFPEKELRHIYTAIRNIRMNVDQYSQTIPKSLLEAEVAEILDNQPTSEAFEMYRQLIDEIYNIPIYDEKIFVDKIKEWIKREKMIIAIEKVIKYLKDKKYEEIRKEIECALNINIDAVDYADITSFESLPDDIKEERGDDIIVRSGFPTLDNCIYGGYGAGEVHIVLAGAKAGKTSFLIQIGTNAVKDGKSVVHITLELSETLVKWKYACCMTGLTYEEIKNEDIFKERMNVFKQKFNPKLFIKKFPIGKTDTLMIKGFIQSLISQGKLEKPDLIIIDYDDLLIPTKPTGKQYEDVGLIYEDMIALGEFFKCPILTPAQTNRLGWIKSQKGEIITSAEMAHSALKKMYCNTIVTLNPQGYDRLILYVDTVRLGTLDKEIDIICDLSRNRYAEYKEGKPVKYIPDIDDVEEDDYQYDF